MTTFISCKEHKEDKKASTDQPIIMIKNDTAGNSNDPAQAPIINIIDTIAAKYTIIYMKDSAAESEGISSKLAKIYGIQLQELIKKENLTITGQPVAWYKTSKAPFFFEAGIPVNKTPKKLSKGVFVKTIGGDSATIAHFYGPYANTYMAYEALADWIKEKHKKKKGIPYEIYVTDPVGEDGKLIDPYKVRTDIVLPHN